MTLSFLELDDTFNTSNSVFLSILLTSHIGDEDDVRGGVHEYFLNFFLLEPTSQLFSGIKLKEDSWMLKSLDLAIFLGAFSFLVINPDNKVGLGFRIDR